MKREVIQDFLNLPGIAGVALMDGRSRPYFCGVDQILNFQQKEALAQGILRVVETIPAGFETFEFQFTGHQVHIYKLEHGIILLVLTRNDLVYADYVQTIKNLKAVLKEDITNAIATFRLIAGNMTLSGVTYRKPSSGTTTLSNAGTITTSGKPVNASELLPSDQTHLPTAPPNASGSESANQPDDTKTRPASTPASDPTLKDLLAALNHVSKFTAQYLGNHVIANYWKSTRPGHDWLGNFQIDRAAQFTFTGPTSQGLTQPLTPQEKQWVQEWVAGFIKRCSQVIRDFPTILEQKALTQAQKALLLGKGQ